MAQRYEFITPTGEPSEIAESVIKATGLPKRLVLSTAVQGLIKNTSSEKYLGVRHEEIYIPSSFSKPIDLTCVFEDLSLVSTAGDPNSILFLKAFQKLLLSIETGVIALHKKTLFKKDEKGTHFFILTDGYYTTANEVTAKHQRMLLVTALSCNVGPDTIV